MWDTWPEPVTVEDMYGDWDWEASVAVTNRSLHPRHSSAIFDVVESLGIGAADTVLDIGGRDAFHALVMAERFGCHVIAVDPAPANVRDGITAIAGHEHGHLVDVRSGTIEQIPVGDADVDLVFSRDMMAHVPDVDAGLAECRRALVPGGHMVVHAVFATDLMEPEEQAWLYAQTAAIPERASASGFESAASDAGFSIMDLDIVGSEFYEATQEDGTAINYALQISRLRRAKDEIIAEVGEIPYRVMYGNALWGTYILIGKLETRVYVLEAGR